MSHTPKKSLGQNFLHDDAVVDRIIAAAQLDPNDVVIEVGPGHGVLTQKLLAHAGHVIAVEVDQELIASLEKKFGNAKNLTIVHGDIRRINIATLLDDHKSTHYKVVANLPYYITSSIVRLFLESQTPPQEMILMVQKEVAERIVAQPGAMSILAVAVQYYSTPRYLFSVPKESFFPVPKVESAVIGITHHARDIHDPATVKKFFRIVKAGFSARRKMLVNNLANSLHMEKSDAEKILLACDLDTTVRAQELSVEQWKKIATQISV